MKRIHKNSLALLVGATAVAAGAGAFTLSVFSLTNVAETAPDHQELLLRTRRYNFKNRETNLESQRRMIEQIIPTLKTWGGKWQLADAQKGDSSENKEIIRATVPVVIFTDDLWIKLEREGDEIVVNARSNSRVGKSDLGENQRHLKQILLALDKKFKL